MLRRSFTRPRFRPAHRRTLPETLVAGKATSAVHDYWDAHTLGFQYVTDPRVVPGTRAFFDHIRPWMSPFKFPWLMERIEREAALLSGRRLLEVGCGLGYVSLEFIRRGARVTATDLTPQAVRLTRRHFALENVQAEDVRLQTFSPCPSATTVSMRYGQTA